MQYGINVKRDVQLVGRKYKKRLECRYVLVEWVVTSEQSRRDVQVKI